MAYATNLPLVAVTEKNRILLNILMGHFSPAEIRELIDGLQLAVRAAEPGWAPAESSVVQPDTNTKAKINGRLLEWARRCQLVPDLEVVPKWF